MMGTLRSTFLLGVAALIITILGNCLLVYDDLQALLAQNSQTHSLPGTLNHFASFGTTILCLIILALVHTSIRREMSTRAEQQRLEEKLQQAGKMAAMGQLAGSVAHNFNNLLTIINGYGSLLQSMIDREDDAYAATEEILNAAERAAALSRQLLAFSRKQKQQRVVLDLNAVVTRVKPLIQGLLREDIELRTIFASNLWPVRTDQAQMEDVLLNLVANARDAMSRGGKLTISTANVDLQSRQLHGRWEIPPGPYASIMVEDTGTGMSQATLSRLFEPFFTTKEVGKGTGLGLASVYGTIQQSGGYIDVDSELGRGTRMTIYLPALREEAVAAGSTPVDSQLLRRGTGTILLAEDEEGVRRLAGVVLRKAGYHVLEARDGTEALQTSREYTGPIDLLLTDTIMPGMGGFELVERLKVERPNMPVLFMSGHSAQGLSLEDQRHLLGRLLEKPFTHRGLTEAVHRALQRENGAVEAAT